MLRTPKSVLVIWAALILLSAPLMRAEEKFALFNVKDYGATGIKAQDAQKLLQKAVDAAAQAGGGMVYLPPGEYTSGTIHLRNHVRFYIEAGATLYASQDPAGFDKPALIYGEDVSNITVEGRGTVEGQAEYFWVKNKEHYVDIEINRSLAEAKGNPVMRPYPKGWPTHPEYPHMIQLRRCKDIRIAGLSFLHSPSWTINPYGCERLVIDGVYIYTSLHEAVWADGIDPDGCKDVVITNCTIETGDDSIVFYSMNWYGAALPCENITITNCRLSSASSALKFCDGNMNAVRNVVVTNCVLTGSNRGIAFMDFDGGIVENVVLSNLVINTHRFDWFWWGDGDPIYFSIQRRSENIGQPLKPDEPPAGKIRNVILRNIIAHGQGSCLITGHPQSWLENVSLENIKLFLSTDPKSDYDKSIHAMQFRYARNLKLKDVEVTWEKPEWPKWQSALYFEDVNGLEVDGFSGKAAKPDFAAVVLDKVADATVRDSKALPGTRVFLEVKGASSREIHLVDNELHDAETAYQVASGASQGIVKAINNF
jgi:hypothetical protein